MAIDPQFIVQLKGKSYPIYAGVLNAATAAGLRSLTTRIVQLPTPENHYMAVVMARAEFDDGRIFEDVGDCSSSSTSPSLAPASLRLASTRAKGRVLRDAINVGMTLLEELPDDDSLPLPGPVPGSEAGALRAAAPEREPAAQGPLACREPGCGKPLTQAQHDLSVRNYGAAFCPTHQRQYPRIA